MVKRSTVDLDEDNKVEEQSCSRWTCEEEILICEYWIETSENSDIKVDRNENSFWGQIMQDFKNDIYIKYTYKYMLKVKEDKVFARTRVTYTNDRSEIFGPEARPRPTGKTRPAKKTKLETTESSGGSASGFISDSLYGNLRRKLQAASSLGSLYEAKKKKKNWHTRSVKNWSFS
ncbi:hypothetical protein Tco_0071587 [Tanacetum coccineum]